MKIACIGAGNMAEAILGGWIQKGLVASGDVCVSDISEERRKQFEKKFGVHTEADNRHAVWDVDLILLAVKPQVLADVLAPLRDALPEKVLVVSIAAGKTTSWLAANLPAGTRIVRVMPNTPALVGQGMSGICAGPGCREGDVEQVQELFAAIGRVAVLDESKMHVLTAISGSGPAYVFYLMEHLIQGGIDQGLDKETALLLVRQTLMGAASLALDAEDGPARLREKVTSKGGTTAAALAVLDEARVSEALIRAVAAATERSRELSADS